MPRNRNVAGNTKTAQTGKQSTEVLTPRIKDRIFDRMLDVQDRLGRQLKSAAPRCPGDVSGGLTACMSALWEVSSLHQRCVALLLEMKFPHDTEALSQLASEVEVNWLCAASGYLQELRGLLPKYRRYLGEPKRSKVGIRKVGTERSRPRRGRGQKG